MKYLKIQNDGVLDIRLVALMGGTTKASNKFKIGQFGTGLKYTLAYLFRNNVDFKIFCGAEEVKLHTETEIIREEQFDIICINGNRTSITTQMGAEWDAWMIIRELWCNALDEGGQKKEVTQECSGEAGTTTFFLQITEAVRQVMTDWGKYFIHDVEAMWRNNVYAIYPPSDKLRIYKQGVLIYEHRESASVFSYDCGNAEINELREFKGSPDKIISDSLHLANEKVAEHFLQTVKDVHYEGRENMTWDWYYHSWSPAWTNVIGTVKLIYPKALEEVKARGSNPDESRLLIVPLALFKSLTTQFDGIGALRVANKSGHFYEHFNEEMEGMLKQGLVILEACNYYMHPELVFIYGYFEDKRVLAQVKLDEKRIYISNTLLQQNLFRVAAMLIEENEHFNTGMEDNTREFQQHFINLYTRALLAKAEVEI